MRKGLSLVSNRCVHLYKVVIVVDFVLLVNQIQPMQLIVNTFIRLSYLYTIYTMETNIKTKEIKV